MSDNQHAIGNAAAWLGSIVEMVEALDTSDSSDTGPEREAAERIIHESVLSVEVRDGWRVPGGRHDDGPNNEPQEFSILLSTGGPALRIYGRLGLCSHPERNSLELQWQGWGTPWTEYKVTGAERDAMLTFASRFWFGE
jgi:hypothetical protein